MARSIAIGSRRTNTRYMVLALALALLSAALIYVALARSSETQTAPTGSLAPVAVAKESIPAWTRITATMVEVRMVPATARTEGAYAGVDAVVGTTARYPIATGEQMLPSKVISANTRIGRDALSYVVPDGMRAVAVAATRVMSAGGLVLPGDYVDVLWDFPKDRPFRNTVLLQNVEVTAVEQKVIDVPPDTDPSKEGGQRARISDAVAQPDAVVVTLLLTPEQAQRVFLAEQTGTIRLAVRSFGDSSALSSLPVQLWDLVPMNLIPEDLVPKGARP